MLVCTSFYTSGRQFFSPNCSSCSEVCGLFIGRGAAYTWPCWSHWRDQWYNVNFINAYPYIASKCTVSLFTVVQGHLLKPGRGSCQRLFGSYHEALSWSIPQDFEETRRKTEGVLWSQRFLQVCIQIYNWSFMSDQCMQLCIVHINSMLFIFNTRACLVLLHVWMWQTRMCSCVGLVHWLHWQTALPWSLLSMLLTQPNQDALLADLEQLWHWSCNGILPNSQSADPSCAKKLWWLWRVWPPVWISRLPSIRHPNAGTAILMVVMSCISNLNCCLFTCFHRVVCIHPSYTTIHLYC